MQKNDQEPQEMLVLSDDIFSVDELEERIELASIAIAASTCNANYCASNTCAGNVNSGW